MPHSLIPVTVLSGFLGSGKTTLLKNILMNRGGMKIALIVNDMSELNIDAHEIEREVALSRTEETLVEMSNGCVCCTLRDDLLKAVESLAKEEKYDAIVIETTGISEPVPIAQTFSFVDEESGIDLSKYARLDTMVTVVDASEFLKNFSSQESLKDRGEVADEHDVRTIVDLMTEQVEFCDIIVVNKTELIDSESLEIVRKILTGLNPTAQRIETSFGKVAIERVINTGLFHMEKAQNSPLWIRELMSGGHHAHTPETEEYGISSCVYRRNRPFHPERFLALANEEWPGVIRSKGIFWLASRHDIAGNWGQAGGSVRVDPAGRWAASFSAEELKNYPEVAAELQGQSMEKYGDRRQELVIISIRDTLRDIESKLDAVLLSDEEFAKGPEIWKTYTDNWPEWVHEAPVN